MIKVQNVSKYYGQRKAINDISFEIKEGEVVGFLGPNGAGKTTTMKMLTGLMAPTHGQLHVNGIEVFEDPVLAKSFMGYLPETPPIYMDMNVYAYLDYVCDLKGVPRKEKAERISEVIQDLKLEGVKKRMIKHLSKGYKQRVGIGQALVSRPKVLVLDEPTSGLDPGQVAEFRNIINKLKGRHTVILSTHILSEVQACCERVIIINEGEIVAENSIEGLSNLTTGSKNIILKLKEVKPDFISQLESLEDVQSLRQEANKLIIQCENAEKSLEKLALLAIEAEAGLLEIRQEEMPLEKIFIDLTHSGAKPKTMPLPKKEEENLQESKQ